MLLPHHDGPGAEPFDLSHELPHLHITHASEAIDTNHNGFSDAVERSFGLDPTSPHSHLYLDLQHGQLLLSNHPSHLADSDHDGFPDVVERVLGTDQMSALDHPVVVEAHHFPAGSEFNLPGTHDLSLGHWVLP